MHRKGESMRARFIVALITALVVIVSCGKEKVTRVTDDTGPVPPDWIYVALTTSTGITLHWTDATTDESGFVIERSTSAGSGFAQVDQTLADVEEYLDDSVIPNTTYYYRVRTMDLIGRLSKAGSSLRADAMDNASPLLPTAPSPADNTSDLDPAGLLTLTWETSDADGPAPTCELYFGEARNALSSLAQGLTTYTHTFSDTLAWTRFFFWRIAARDAHGATALSPIWSFGTKIERISVPTGYFFMGDCGQFLPADTLTFCPSVNPVSTGAFNIDKLEVSNQLFAQFLNELLHPAVGGPWINVTDGLVTSKVPDTLFAEVYPEGDDDSGIEFIENQSGGVFVPRAGRENHPAVEVTWQGARRFAARYGRRLPTEAEWEKAARGTSGALGYYHFLNGELPDSVGVGVPYPWGEVATGAYANYEGSGDPYESPVGVATTPIGFFDGKQRLGFSTRSNASPYGALDMAGNVAEWCEDTYVPYHSGANADLKVVKGGGWRSQPGWCRTFWRVGEHPDTTDNLIGFRTTASE
jgi:formylglycine-generating enzyme required for sulfatase activity